jgi:hypothetical protein
LALFWWNSEFIRYNKYLPYQGNMFDRTLRCNHQRKNSWPRICMIFHGNFDTFIEVQKIAKDSNNTCIWTLCCVLNCYEAMVHCQNFMDPLFTFDRSQLFIILFFRETFQSEAFCTYHCSLSAHAGQPKRHLLTTGWSVFVSTKRLLAGDSVLFIR